jgi:hypothetical protein
VTADQEILYFERINSKYWNYDDWKKSESPDFLVKVGNKIIGIEFTEVTKKYPGNNDAKRYSLEDKLTKIITNQLNESSMNLNLYGNINFKSDLNLSQENVETFCHRVTSAIIAHSKSLKKESWSANHYLDKFLPDEINWISYDCYPFMEESKFYASKGKTLEFLNEADVFHAIENKESKYHEYLNKCDEVHLVLLEGLIPASWIGKLEKPIARIDTIFNKVFLFHTSDSELIELY